VEKRDRKREQRPSFFTYLDRKRESRREVGERRGFERAGVKEEKKRRKKKRGKKIKRKRKHD
jgi:hypothetical protein